MKGITHYILIIFANLLLLQQSDSVYQGKEIFLIEAIHQKKIEIVEWLLNQNAFIDVQDVDGRTPLIHAVSMENNIESVKLLLKFRANENIADVNGSTALHYAVKAGSLETLDILGKNISKLSDKYGRTPLHIALEMDNEDAMAYLLDSGLNPYDQVNNTLPIVHAASMQGKTSMLQILKSKNTTFNFIANGTTPLNLAIKYGHQTTVEYIIQNGADPDKPDVYLWTPLHVAASAGNLDIIKILIEKSASIDPINSNIETPLHLAVKKGHLPVVQYLIEQGANISCKDVNGNSLLHSAAFIGNLDIIKYLVDKGVDINEVNNNGNTAMAVAALEKHLEATDFLIDCGVEIHTSDKNGTSLVVALAVLGNVNLMRKVQLLANFTYNIRDINGTTPLHHAAAGNSTDMVEYLINTLADVYLQTNSFASKFKQSTHFKLKMCPFCYKNVTNSKDLEGRTPAHYAAAVGNADILEVLHKFGGNFNISDRYGQNSLHIAAATGQNIEILSILGLYIGSVETQDVIGRTALFLAAEGGHIEVTKYLNYVGADFSATDKDEKTILHAAASQGHTQLILEFRAQLMHFINNRDKYGFTPSWYALTEKHFETLDTLLLMGSDLNPQWYVFEFVEKGEVSILKYIFNKYNISMFMTSKDKGTIIHYSVQSDQIQVIKEFGNNKCLVNLQDYLGISPSWYALSDEKWDILKELHNRGGEIIPPYDLSEAVENNKIEIVKYLIDQGLPYETSSEPPVFIAVRQGNYNMIKFLHESGFELNTVWQGKSLLKVAKENNECDILQYLLNQGVWNDDVFNNDHVYNNWQYNTFCQRVILAPRNNKLKPNNLYEYN